MTTPSHDPTPMEAAMPEARDEQVWKIIMAALHSRDGHALKHTHGELTEAILAALSSAGLAVVPVEPTWSMVVEGADAGVGLWDEIALNGATDCYRAMIAAALPPLASGGG